MKKILLLIFILAASQSRGQDEVQPQKKFGLIASVQNPMFTEGIAAQIDFGFKVVPNIAVFYEMKLTEKIHFRPRLMYSPQGDRTPNEQRYPGTNNLDYHLNYINIPLDIKFWNRIYVIAGPQLGLLISEHATGVYDGPAKSGIDFGANLSLGFKIKKVFLEVGAYQGLIPVLEYNSYGKRQIHNAMLRLSLGWYLF